jgi:hypothetical protein
MNILRPSKIRLVIVGATGMVGGYVLRYALEQPVVESVTAIVRRNLGISHAKIREVQMEISLTAPHSRRCSQARTRRSFASARILGRFQTRNSERSQWTTRSSSREFSAAAAPTPRVSDSVPQPGDPCRRLSESHGGCRRAWNRGRSNFRKS